MKLPSCVRGPRQILRTTLGVGIAERVVAQLCANERLGIVSAVKGIINDAVLHAIVSVAGGNRGGSGGVEFGF